MLSIAAVPDDREALASQCADLSLGVPEGDSGAMTASLDGPGLAATLASVSGSATYQHILFDTATGTPYAAPQGLALVPADIAPLGSSSYVGLTPRQIRTAYGITGDGAGTTIAIVDAYDDPNIVGDLHQFDQQFGLSDPVFTKVQVGFSGSNADSGWITEIALDVEWAHAVAPAASILLVEAQDNSDVNMHAAVDHARNASSVVAVSMSWGDDENSSETSYDSHFTTPGGHTGITFLASTGDTGAPGGYPAYSPNVVAVGGTTLTLNGDNYVSETAWSGSGGGQSTIETEPSYQNGVQMSGRRQIPDVAFDANPASGVAVYDSYNGGANPWYKIGGTSVSSPCWAGLIAIVDQIRASQGLTSLDGRSQALPNLYGLSWADFHDVTSGSNGFPAKTGYDLATGQGTPVADKLTADLAMFVPPPAVSSTTPSLSGGTLVAGSTTLAVNFSEAVTGADQAANYALRGLGADGMLGTADDTVVSLSSSYNGTTATLTFSALPEDVYRLTICDTITDAVGTKLDGDGDSRPGGNCVLDFVVIPASPVPVTLNSPHGLPFDIAVGSFGAGELVQGPGNAFDGDGRLMVGGTAYQPGSLGYVLTDSGQSVVTASGTVAGLTVSRTVTVPTTGGEDFARTIDTFTNPSVTPITTTVQILCNLGSNSATTVFATSSGDTTVSPSDQWIGTDDAFDGYGTPAVIHYIHGPSGLQPSSVSLVGDNLVWTYGITVPAGQTIQLASFTIVSTTQAGAISAAATLVTSSWFGDKADAFLTPSQSAALANFVFPPPTVVSTSPTLGGGSLAAGSTSLAVNFSRPVVGADLAANYNLQSSGADGLLNTADDVVVPLSAGYSGTMATLTFSPLPEQVYRLTVRSTITDASGNPLHGSGGAASDWGSDFVAVATGTLAPVTLASPHGLPFDVAVGAFGEGELIQGSNNAFDGDGRLFVNGTAFQPTTAGYTLGDSGHTVIAASGVTAGLTVQREVTVPISGGADMARTIDMFTNPSASAVTVGVQIVGNLGSDANTTVFGTSSGDTLFTPADQWVGTDDNVDGGGTPAVIHYLRSFFGAPPSAVSIIGDNISWTYSLTVPAAGTVRLAYFTIVGTTRSQAIAAANALVTTDGFNDQAGQYLTPSQIGSLANFVFPGTIPPVILSTSPALTGGSLAAGTTSLGITFSKPVIGAATASNYQLQNAGPDGVLGTADDVVLTLTAGYHGAKASLVCAPLMENVYRLTVHNTITDFAGNVLQGSVSSGTGDWATDFVVTPSSATVYAPSPYATGSNNPQSVVVADFNRDGIPDIAAANTNGSVAILLGDGSGRFSAATTFSDGGSYSYSVAAGDFNADGNLDLAVANFNSNNVGVLLGDGTGRFSAATTYSCGGTHPEWLSAADLNGDGVLDLATANEGSGTIGLLLGNGNGTFQPVTTMNSGGSKPDALAFADFNGNNRLDLAVADQVSNSVAIFQNSGGGSFTFVGSYGSGGNCPNGLAVGDFNGDGKPDLVVSNNTASSSGGGTGNGVVRLLLNNGSGGFIPTTPVTLAESTAQQIAVGDFNTDGKLDVAVNYAFKVAILWGTGAGALASSTVLFSPVATPVGIAAADLNGDGKLDLVIGSGNGKMVGVLLNDGHGGFAPPDSSDFASGGNEPFGMATADFNKDGKLDLAVANQTSNTVGILLGNGDGTFAAAGTYTTGGTWTQFLATGDFNGDGNPDIVVTNCNQGTVGVLLGDGQGHFLSAVTYSTGLGRPSRVQTADFNHDGNLDLLVFGSAAGNGDVAVLLGTGTGAFSAPMTFNTGSNSSIDAAIGDLNRDGILDLVVANGGSNSNTLGILLGDGTGGFSSPVTVSAGTTSLSDLAGGDFNKDGSLDVAVVSIFSTVGIFFGNGQGGFSNSSPVSYTSLPNGNAIIAADLNGDGNVDLALTSLNNSVGILLGNAAGAFLPVVTYAVNGLEPYYITSGDFNGDGKPDLAEANWQSNSVGVLLNTSGPAPVTLNSPSGLPFDIAAGRFGTGQLVQGSNNAFDGDGRLFVGGQPFCPSLSARTFADSGHTVIPSAGTAAGLTISRKVTVPNTGSQDFARTVDYFQNTTASPITTTVTIVGNLGSDGATRVFATSNGGTTPTVNDEWFGTDGGPGTTALIHIVHGPLGLKPAAVSVIGDNIEWTYTITVPANQTLELTTFTIQATTEANAIAAANALVTPTGFGGQAAAFLGQTDLASLANFQFPPPAVVSYSLADDTGSSNSDQVTNDNTPVLTFVFNKIVQGTNAGVSVTHSSGASVTPNNITGWGTNTLTVTFSTALGDDVYNVTLNHAIITDLAGNPLNGNQANGDDLRTFTIDTTAPVAPSTPVLDPSTDSGVLGDNITNFTTPTFDHSGLTSPPDYFRFYRNGTQISGSYQSGTTYTTATQTDGTYLYQLSAVDAAGNESPLSPGLTVTIDTTAPVVSSASPSETMIEASNRGTNLVVRVTFSEPMWYGYVPQISFSPDVIASGELTLVPDQTFWVSPTQYNASFSVANPGVYVPAVGITVTGVKDLAGNPGAPTTFANDFDIDTLRIPAHVTSAQPSVSEVSQLNIGKPDLNAPVGQGFVVGVTYDTDMAYNAGYTPVVTISSPDASPTLTFDAADSWWVNPTTYRAGFDVSGASTQDVQGFHIAVASGHDLANQDVQARYVSGEAFNINMTHTLPRAYVVNSYPYLTLISNRNVGTDKFGVTVSYNTGMSMGANLAFSFSQGGNPVDLSSVLVQDTLGSYWINSTDYKVQYTVKPGSSVNLSNISIVVTGGQDPVGNPPTAYTSPALFSIDTHDPPAPLVHVASITTNLETVTAADTVEHGGADSFSVTVTYDQQMMWYASIPTINFVGDSNWYPVAGLLQLDSANSFWVGTDTYRAKYNVQNFYTIVNPSVNITVTGGKDAYGNLETPFSGLTYPADYFEVNTAATAPLASVASVTPSVTTVTKANVGAPSAHGLVETITFSESMASAVPTVTLTANDPTQQANLDATLSFDANWSWWADYPNDTVFLAGFDVADSGVLGSAAGITIHVKWARSNTAPYYDQARYSGPANFNLDTVTPVSLGSLTASPSAASLTDAVLSSGALNLSVGSLATSTNDQQTDITPIDKVLALTGTWLDV